MTYIHLSKDLSLTVTHYENICRGDNLSQLITFLIPLTVDEVEVETATVYLHYIRPDGYADIITLAPDETMYNSDYYKYSIPVTCELTRQHGDVRMWLEFYAGDPSNPTVRKSDECNLPILEAESMDECLGDCQIGALYQMQQDIRELKKNPPSAEITEETDPTVPAWAKEPAKPSYTASEVGAVPAPSTASVGQTIVVKAVDENGKPTEWETKDIIEELRESGSIGYYATQPDLTFDGNTENGAGIQFEGFNYAKISNKYYDLSKWSTCSVNAYGADETEIISKADGICEVSTYGDIDVLRIIDSYEGLALSIHDNANTALPGVYVLVVPDEIYVSKIEFENGAIPINPEFINVDVDRELDEESAKPIANFAVTNAIDDLKRRINESPDVTELEETVEELDRFVTEMDGVVTALDINLNTTGEALLRLETTVSSLEDTVTERLDNNRVCLPVVEISEPAEEGVELSEEELAQLNNVLKLDSKMCIIYITDSDAYLPTVCRVMKNAGLIVGISYNWHENTWYQIGLRFDLENEVWLAFASCGGAQVSDEQINSAVENYLEENPVSSASATIENNILKVT